MLPAPGIYSAASFREGDVILFWNEEFCVKASAAESGDYSRCDDAVEFVLKKAPVWAAFAGGVEAVTVVDEDFHVAAYLALQQSPDSKGKDIENYLILSR